MKTDGETDLRADERDHALLSNDPYTFFVLGRILREPCELIRTDHKSVILCHSEGKFPVWIWTPDGARDEIKEKAWLWAEECRPLRKGYRYNMKYELAGFFAERAKRTGINVGYAAQLYAYDCPDPVAPKIGTDGGAHMCTWRDEEEAASLMPLFYKEIGDEPSSPETCLEKARAYIEADSFFFWKNALGKTVALCYFRLNQGLAGLSGVFTLAEERRKHYAQNLVYHVTKHVKDMGFTPMLYTDANYAASNACYAKIGYVLRGKLCTIAAGNQMKKEV